MSCRFAFSFLLPTGFLAFLLTMPPAPACCPAPKSGKPVVNADQTVIILWDAKKKQQHFIRKASFKSESEDFGFLIPSPSLPELSESGNHAFPYLKDLTKPKVMTMERPASGFSCGCSSKKVTKDKSWNEVKVELEKEVAGFQAAVLKATSAKALVGWLKDNGYAYSPEIQAWAKPYIDQNWRITALKIAQKNDKEKEDNTVVAKALRMSFQTDRPLFPYREPAYDNNAKKLVQNSRLLRIYFIADARYKGEMTKNHPWSGKIAWANQLTMENRREILKRLNLPENTGPKQWWLTEFEDDWPYEVAPSDVYFSKDQDQNVIERDPIIQYTMSKWPDDLMVYAFPVAIIVPLLVRRGRRNKK